MSMSRQHFESIAEAVRVSRPDASPGDDAALDRVADNLAANLAMFNRKFDKEAFLAACGNREKSDV